MLALLAGATGTPLAVAQPAAAYSESYGFVAVANNGYVQSAEAHSFIFNTGAGENHGQLACQLFNHKNADEVGHGNGVCSVFYGGGEFVWGRVYNESGVTETLAGEAET